MSSNAVASSSKHPLDAEGSSSKKHKKSSSDRKHKSHKHKKHHHHHRHEHGVDAEDAAGASGHKHKSKSHKSREGPFEHRRSKMRLSVPPKFGGDYMAGVTDILNSMIMRYVPQVNGVLLAHWNHELLDNTVKVINECPFGVCEVEFDALVWAPKIGQRLYGTHSLSSPSHLSLLFSKTFNISIPLNHIPPDEYEFEHTALDPDAEDEDEDDDISDPEDEFGPGAFGHARGLAGLLASASGGGKNGVHEAGRWKSKETGKLVGDGGKGIKFTVIGMQVTNQMLSLTGSLLADPSNPPPPPESQSAAQAAAYESSPEPEDLHALDMAEGGLAVDSSRPPASKKPRKSAGAAAASKTFQPPTIQNNVTAGPAGGASGAAPTATPAAAASAPIVDDSFLSARELKQKRKDEERAKREARKARKTEGQIEDLQAAGGAAEVGMSDALVRDDVGETAGLEGKAKDMGAGMEGERKRKADVGTAPDAGKKKKRKA